MVRVATRLLTLWCLVFLSGFSAHAGEVRVGIGFALAPYVLPEENRGLEVDIIRAALKEAGYDALFFYLPNLRLPVAYQAGDVDCIAANVEYDLGGDSATEAHGSEVTVIYRNYAISQGPDGSELSSINDLKDKTVLGFTNASKYLGPEFASMAAANPGYSELSDQSLQACMLYTGRVDVVISDKRIFLYSRKQMIESEMAKFVDFEQRIVFSPIFPSAPRNVTFRDSALVEAFNKGLEVVRESGQFQRIIEQYVGVEGN